MRPPVLVSHQGRTMAGSFVAALTMQVPSSTDDRGILGFSPQALGLRVADVGVRCRRNLYLFCGSAALCKRAWQFSLIQQRQVQMLEDRCLH